MDERLKRLILGDRQTIAGTVYGTIIVMSVIAAGAKANEHHLWRLVVLAGGSSAVLWLAHVYAHGLGESLSLGRRVTVEELASIARRSIRFSPQRSSRSSQLGSALWASSRSEQPFSSRSGSGLSCLALKGFDTRAWST